MIYCLLPVVTATGKRKNFRLPFDENDPWEPQIAVKPMLEGMGDVRVGHPYRMGEKTCFLGCCNWDDDQ